MQLVANPLSASNENEILPMIMKLGTSLSNHGTDLFLLYYIIGEL